MQCNICGGKTFTDMPARPAVRCTGCGSLERTRLTALHIARFIALRPDMRVLHFAPERGLSALLRAATGPGYRTLDIAPENYPGLGVERFDLCRDIFSLVPNSCDLIIHNHVIEHIECNYTIVLQKLTQALTDTGTMLFTAPILKGEFTDDLVIASHEDKLARFGPMLHVRRFGRDFVGQTLGMIFNLPERYDLCATFTPDELRAANVPERHWDKYTGAAVFRVGRGDLR